MAFFASSALEDPDLFSGIVLFIMLATLGSVALFATLNHRQTLRFQLQLFLCALAIRFALSIAIYLFGLIDVIGDEDASGWLRGVDFRRSWLRQGVNLLQLPVVLLGAFSEQHRGYYYLLGSFFYLTDTPTRLPAAALNCFFGALTVVFTYRIARALFSPWVAKRVGWLVCLFPSMIIWSAQTIKEPVVILLETAALYGCVHLRCLGFSLRHIFLCGLTILLLIPFRSYAGFIVAATVVLVLALPRFGERKLTLSSALGVIMLIVPLVVLSGVLVRQEVQLESFDLKYIESFRHFTSVGTSSAFGSDYDLQSPAGFSAALAVGAAHLMLAPFPWQLGFGSLRMLLTGPELIVWWWLFFVGVLPGLWHAIRNRFNDVQPLLLFLTGLGLLYSLMSGNVGLVYRQRAQLLPWLLIFAAVGLEQRALRQFAKKRARIGDQMLTIKELKIKN